MIVLQFFVGDFVLKYKKRAFRTFMEKQRNMNNLYNLKKP